MRPIVKALNKAAADRGKDENKQLCAYFADVKCFRDLNCTQTDMLKLINCVTLQFVPKHEILFRIGEFGTTFYVSLTGKAQLFLPNPELRVLKHQKVELQQDLDEKIEQLQDLRT